MLCVADCIAYSNRPVIPQATKGQRIGNQIDAAMILTWSDFVGVHRFMCVVVREDQGFGFACKASPVRSGKKKHTVPAMTIATITATTILTAGSTESGRPQLGQVRALGLTSWSQSGQGLVMATLNHKAVRRKACSRVSITLGSRIVNSDHGLM